MQVNIHSTVIHVKSNIALAQDLIPDKGIFNSENVRKCWHISNEYIIGFSVSLVSRLELTALTSLYIDI